MPDRIVDGEERWHTVGTMVLGGGFKIVVVVHAYPDPDDETWIHVISLRRGNGHERRQYEVSRSDGRTLTPAEIARLDEIEAGWVMMRNFRISDAAWATAQRGKHARPKREAIPSSWTLM